MPLSNDPVTMPLFEYRGLTKDGKTVRGSLDADNVRNARLKLKRDGIFITDLKNKAKETERKRTSKSGGSADQTVNVQDLSMMTRQLATLIKANIPLVDALGAVADQVENPILKDAMSDIKNQVNEGGSFNKGLRKYPKIFDKVYVSMCEAGEASGTLDIILIRLAEFTEAQNELNKKITSAMMYPALMFFFTIAVLMLLFVYVIPKVTSIFEQMDMKLPWYSQLIIEISGFMVNYWMFILGSIFVASILFRNWKNTPTGSAQWDAIILKLPIVGPLARMIAVSRFTRTLSTLLAGGVPMLNAMDIVKNVVNNAVLSDAVASARDNISEGESVAVPLKKSGQFPPIVIHMIAIGEKTGELEGMLTQVSDAYDFQVKNQVQGLTSVLEPIMIVVMGTVIGVIVYAIMIPIFEMSSNFSV